MAKLRAVPAADPQISLQSSLSPQRVPTEMKPTASGHAKLIIIFRNLTPTLSDGLCEGLGPFSGKLLHWIDCIFFYYPQFHFCTFYWNKNFVKQFYALKNFVLAAIDKLLRIHYIKIDTNIIYKYILFYFNDDLKQKTNSKYCRKLLIWCFSMKCSVNEN